MDSQALSDSISDLTSSLGDPTRRGIYIAVREAPEPATASQIADLFSIHPNVARHHLDRLADDGYLIIGHSESLHKISNDFRLIGKTIYSKAG